MPPSWKVSLPLPSTSPVDDRALRQRQRVAGVGKPDRRNGSLLMVPALKTEDPPSRNWIASVRAADGAGIEDRRIGATGENSYKAARDAGAGIVGHHRTGAGANGVAAGGGNAAGIGDIGRACVGANSVGIAHDDGIGIIDHRRIGAGENAGADEHGRAGDAAGIGDVDRASVGEDAVIAAGDVAAGSVGHRRVYIGGNASRVPVMIPELVTRLPPCWRRSCIVPRDAGAGGVDQRRVQVLAEVPVSAVPVMLL